MPVLDTDTAEGKAELQKLIDKETAGLKDKNAELLGDLKKQKESMKSIQDQIDEIKEAKEAAELEAAKKSGDVDKQVTAAVAKKDKEIDTLKAANAALNEKYSTGIVDRDLTDALAKSGIVSDSLEDVRIIFKAKHKIEVGESGATVEGKPLKDFVSEWSQGDAAKRYVAAQNNSGGGANGSNGSSKAGAKTLTRNEFEALDAGKQMEFSKAGGKLTD